MMSSAVTSSAEASSALESFVEQRTSELESRGIVVEQATVSGLAGGYGKVWREQSDWEHLLSGLRKAGLPD